MEHTLPEITIVGSPASDSSTPADFFCDGFMWGWNNPGSSAEAPAPLEESLLAAYFEGVSSGQSARTQIAAGTQDASGEYDGPEIGPDIGGESFEAVENAWREAWSEFLNHREEPHIEPPEIEIVLR